MAEDYSVESGDCMSSIAFSHGFFWETLWNHSSNSDLKSKRKDPNILVAGDVVHIPDLTIKQEDCATEKRHEFKLKGVPAKLKLKVMRPKKQKDTKKDGGGGGTGGSGPGGLPSIPGGGSGADSGDASLEDPDYEPQKLEEEPFANAPYILEVDGVVADKGQTDGDGCVEIKIPPNAEKGILTVDKGKDDERIIPLDLGDMDPVDEVTGVRKRLSNLGYHCQPDGPEDASDLQAALGSFQQDNSLQVTGKVDDPSRNKLKDLHGS
jgi:N-acetylmuramoyl-L-alanine amidase